MPRIDYDPSLDVAGPLQDRTPQEASPARSQRHSKSRGLGWTLWQLFVAFNPRAFFEYIALLTPPWVTTLCALTFGVSGAFDWLMRLVSKHRIGEQWVHGWGWILPAILGFGIIFAMFTYAIGGWWFNVRANWCTYHHTDPGLTRKIYVLAAQAFAAPATLAVLAFPIFFDGPREATESAAFLWWIKIRFWMVLRSNWAAYTGVRTIFQSNRSSSLLWFVILPTVWNLLSTTVMLAAARGLLVRP